MESTRGQERFRQGDEVVALDGETIGKLYGIEDGYLVVEKGWLFPKDYQVPLSVIESYDAANGVIHLSVTKDEALNSGWEQRDDADYLGTVGLDADTTNASSTGATYPSGPESDETYLEDQSLTATGSDHLIVPVYEEELQATKTIREAGEVGVTKRVVAEEQTLEVPVTEERVNITRRTVDRDATTGEDVFTEEQIDVPLRTEEVNLEKRARVAEEIEINKEQVQRTERVSDTVRKEVVDVDEVTADPTLRDLDEGTGRRA